MPTQNAQNRGNVKNAKNVKSCGGLTPPFPTKKRNGQNQGTFQNVKM